MGVVRTHRRGIAAGARAMLQNTGAVISIAFVLAIVTAAVPKPVLFKIFSGLASGLSTVQLDPFIANMHLALWVLARISLLGAGVSMLRPAHVREDAERVGATPQTIRYYEEIGLLPGGSDARARTAGAGAEARSRARRGRAPHRAGATARGRRVRRLGAARPAARRLERRPRRNRARPAGERPRRLRRRERQRHLARRDNIAQAEVDEEVRVRPPGGEALGIGHGDLVHLIEQVIPDLLQHRLALVA